MKHHKRIYLFGRYWLLKPSLGIFMVLIYFTAPGQSTLGIADTTKSWHTLYYGFGAWGIINCSGTRINRLAEKTVFNDTSFFKVYESTDSLQQLWNPIGYLSEDSLSGKVFFGNPYINRTGLIYDFNLSAGDSVIVDNYYVNFENILLICDSIKAVSIYGTARKQFFFSSPQTTSIADVWIEGIGSIYGLLNSGVFGVPLGGGGMKLLCCSEDGNLIFRDSTYHSCFISEFYPKITSEKLDTAFLNKYYEFQIQLAGTNHVGAYSLNGTVIPDGFSLNETTGLLTGTPVATGTFPCVITVINQDMGAETDILFADITVVLPTNTDEVPEHEVVKILPNPCVTGFSVSYGNNSENIYYLEIFSHKGKMIEMKIIKESGTWIDVSHYKTGIYLLRFTDLNKRAVKTKKMMKI